MKYSESIEIEKHSELSLTERLKYILKIENKYIYDLHFVPEILLLGLMIVLSILALYRLWIKCARLSKMLKLLLSLSLFFPGAVIIVLIITYYVDGCINVINVKNNYIANSVIYESK